jgi:hypothetical protein
MRVLWFLLFGLFVGTLARFVSATPQEAAMNDKASRANLDAVVSVRDRVVEVRFATSRALAAPLLGSTP